MFTRMINKGLGSFRYFRKRMLAAYWRDPGLALMAVLSAAAFLATAKLSVVMFIALEGLTSLPVALFSLTVTILIAIAALFLALVTIAFIHTTAVTISNKKQIEKEYREFISQYSELSDYRWKNEVDRALRRIKVGKNPEEMALSAMILSYIIKNSRSQN